MNIILFTNEHGKYQVMRKEVEKKHTQLIESSEIEGSSEHLLKEKNRTQSQH